MADTHEEPILGDLSISIFSVCGLNFEGKGDVTPRIDPFVKIVIGNTAKETSKLTCRPLFGDFSTINFNETLVLYVLDCEWVSIFL